MHFIAEGTALPRTHSWTDIPLRELDEVNLYVLGKRGIDLILSLIFVIAFSPVFLILALITFISSPGPVLYRQERIGLHGKPFTMYKFRSMDRHAEPEGPVLAVPNDTRITGWGRFMRRYKLDETPQFFNVIEGSMSLVGPRPERKHFRDQVKRIYPGFEKLSLVKPGLTSLGQIKFGYASDLKQMRSRARFDVLYLDAVSLSTDLKIMALTISHVLMSKQSKSKIEA